MTVPLNRTKTAVAATAAGLPRRRAFIRKKVSGAKRLIQGPIRTQKLIGEAPDSQAPAAPRRQFLDGGSTYRLNVPANAPVTQYWSATVYDRATHGLIRNLPSPSRSSQTPGLRKNPNGSVDIYFGPKAPASGEANWVPTSADGKFEVLFRFYGPEKALFEKAWKLPDVEKVAAQ